jgi:hypothetical protein
MSRSSIYLSLPHEGETLYLVGILADGSLHNPRGYPDDAVRAAVMAADERRHQRRSRAAHKATKTRPVRRDLRTYALAQQLTLNGEPVGPRSTCAVCGRQLDDPPSVARGIGPECWQDVLKSMEASQ